MSRTQYCGRFAPSPTGPLHRGSLVAALASWLDARAHQGCWLVRIEDLDPPREQPGAAEAQLEALTRLGLAPDEPVSYQSARTALYETALSQLQGGGQVYPCRCTRAQVEQAAHRRNLPPNVYPGTCRNVRGGAGPASWRLRVPDRELGFTDRACGVFAQNLAREVGDFVVRRADGLWAYQLAVVVDDGQQGVSHVVRGADLLDNTPRQLHLQRLLGLPVPRYLHVPVVCTDKGEKLSKQTGATPLDLTQPLRELERAWQHLGFESVLAPDVAAFLQRAIRRWSLRFGPEAAAPDTIVASASAGPRWPGAEPDGSP